MKILQIINSHALQDGGAQRLTLEMHRAYLERGHDSHLLSVMPSPTDEKNTYSLGIPHPYQGSVLPRLCRFLGQARWKDVDLVHVHLFPAQVWAGMAVKKVGLKAPLITTEHNTFNRRRGTRLGRLCDQVTLKQYRRIICISEATKEALLQWQPQVRNKLVTIPNGIDLSRYDGFSDNSQRNGVPIILGVGRISEQKNYAAALEAMALLKEREFEYWIAGQDEMNGQMQQMVTRLGLEEKVRFLGYHADIPRLLGEVDIFLMTSAWEGFGLAVAEAMAAGLPVVCSNVPGVREVVGTEERTGFLVNPSSPGEVADRLGRLLDDAPLRWTLGAQARERSRQFDISNTITHHLKLYEDVAQAC